MALMFLLLFYAVIPAGRAVPDSSVLVLVKDVTTGEVLRGGSVYFDGEYAGVIPVRSGDGMFEIPDVGPGTHTVRVNSPGYREKTLQFVFPSQKLVEADLTKDALVLLTPDRPHPHAINVVFYPSSTSFDCSENQKIPDTTYLDNEHRFRVDAMNVINETYLELDRHTAASVPLPADYRHRFNFYYYYDPSAPADAFSGCAGKIPEKYWQEVRFADLTIILYPIYHGTMSAPDCEPVGCFQSFGPGKNVLKAPSDLPMLIAHESGHAIFGLSDTYCGNTFYFENAPYSNVWASDASCEEAARKGFRNASECRQIQRSSPVSCSKNFWRWDPVIDLMETGYTGIFGPASTERIRYILSESGGGSS